MNCHYHKDTKATYRLNRGHRGEPVPLCERCKQELLDIAAHDPSAVSLIKKAK